MCWGFWPEYRRQKWEAPRKYSHRASTDRMKSCCHLMRSGHQRDFLLLMHCCLMCRQRGLSQSLSYQYCHRRGYRLASRLLQTQIYLQNQRQMRAGTTCCLRSSSESRIADRRRLRACKRGSTCKTMSIQANKRARRTAHLEKLELSMMVVSTIGDAIQRYLNALEIPD